MTLTALGFAIACACIAGESENFDRSFKSSEAIEKFAQSQFLSVKSLLFKNENKEVFVILGSKTSGLKSNSIHVYFRIDNSEYKLLLFRSTIFTFIQPVQGKHGIDFKTKTGEIFLSLPWAGVSDGMQFQNP